MKKLLTYFTAALCLLITFRITPNTQAIEQKKVLEATVKIISNKQTKHSHLIDGKIKSDILAEASGSGTIIKNEDKYLVLTNNHVITDSNNEVYEGLSICVVIDRKEIPECQYTGSLVARDKTLDVALIEINPTDIYGNAIPNFPYLSYKTSRLPEEGEDISVWGFPGIGGDTITETKGNVSGYEEEAGHKQLKTDTTIGFGNSGGTALDANGNFIGIPNAIRSQVTTLGYIIPLAEIQDWLEENKDLPKQENPLAIEALSELYGKILETNRKEVYTSTLFPQYQVGIPFPWKTKFINKSHLLVNNTIKGEPLFIVISISVLPYEVNQDVMQFILEKLEKDQHQYTNYQRKRYNFKGLKGYQITYDDGNRRTYFFIAAKENTTFKYRYSVSRENQEEMEKTVKDFFSSFEFIEAKNNTAQYKQEFSQEFPKVKIKTSENFYFNYIYDSQLKNTIVQIESPEKDDFEQNITITENHFPKDYWDLDVSEILKEEVKFIGSRIIHQNDEIMIDGLRGYTFTYSLPGDDFNQERIRTIVVARKDKKKYFEFQYDHLKEYYYKNLPKFIAVLKSFEYGGEENQDRKGKYNIPNFNPIFNDLQNHLYEEEIKALDSKDILPYEGESFYPEKKITRKEALQTVINSKIFIEKGRNLRTTQKALSLISTTPKFDDVHDKKFIKILNYSAQEGFINTKELFNPDGAVHLADLLSILCKTYELPVWSPDYLTEIDWYIPYMYKGFELGIIPEGSKHFTQINRGQLASVVYNFVRIVGERNDL